MVHTGDVHEKISEAKDTLLRAENYMDGLGKEIDRLQKRKMSDREVTECIQVLLPLEDGFSAQQTKNVKRLREDMHIFSAVPNLTDANFGGNLSGVAVSYKLWGLEQICAIKERKFKRGLQRRIELITHILNIQGGQFDYRDIDIQFRRNKPQNVLEIAQIITMLSGELSRETRLQMLPTIDNVQDELQKLEDEKQQEVNSFGQYNALAQALAQAKAQPEGAEASPEDEPEEKAGEGA